MKFLTRLYATNPVAFEAYSSARVLYKESVPSTSHLTNQWREGRRDAAVWIISSMIRTYRHELHKRIRLLNQLRTSRQIDVSGDVVVLG